MRKTLAVIIILFSFGVTVYCSELSVDELYSRAVEDAKIIEDDEFYPLVAIDSRDEKILVCTWHKKSDIYKTGENVSIDNYVLWVFTAKEIENWAKRNNNIDNKPLRFKQLIGLPPNSNYTNFSYIWVDTKDLWRPAYDNYISDSWTDMTFPDGTDKEYIGWFNDNAKYSYEGNKYPWTRLGYTYDWSDNDSEYGLSEFVIKVGSKVKVEKTYTNDEYFNYLFKSADPLID